MKNYLLKFIGFILMSGIVKYVLRFILSKKEIATTIIEKTDTKTTITKTKPKLPIETKEKIKNADFFELIKMLKK